MTSRSRTALDEPTTRVVSRGDRLRDHRGDGEGGRVGVAEVLVGSAAESGVVGRIDERSSQPVVCFTPGVEPGGGRRRRRRAARRRPPARPGRGRSPRRHGRGPRGCPGAGSVMRLMTGRERVGWPTTMTRSTRRAGRCRAAGGRCEWPGVPMRAPDVGSASEGPVGGLGEQSRGRSGVVAGDDDGARPERSTQPQSAPPDGAMFRCGSWPRFGLRHVRRRRCRAGPPGGGIGVGGHEVAVELDVELGRTHPRAGLVRSRRDRSRAAHPAVRSWHGANRPKMPAWSVVWLAPVPRSRSGRSAVTTTTDVRCGAPP